MDDIASILPASYSSSDEGRNTKWAGMPSYACIGDVPISVMNGTTGNALIDAVLLERRYEFVGEPSQRMYDIWRYKLGDQVYGPVEGIPVDENLPGDLVGPRTTYANTTKVWDDKFYLLPIPQEALDVNPNLFPIIRNGKIEIPTGLL